LVTTQPRTPLGKSAADTDRTANSISDATPARSALATAAPIAPASRSDPRIVDVDVGRARADSSARTRSPTVRETPGHRSAAKGRAAPGGTPRATSAASIGIVPEPQNGSTRGDSASQPEAAMSAAAMVSRSGALAVACR
jgi:hypothetical protein